MEPHGKRKRKPSSSTAAVLTTTTASTVILAALSSSNPSSHRTLLSKCLRHLSFHDPLLLSLLPSLLTLPSPSLASRAADSLGSAALNSLELNQIIASDADVIRALLSSLRCRSVSACNAVLDLCTTAVGRLRFIELSALHSILFRLLEIYKYSTASVSLCSSSFDRNDLSLVSVGFKEDEFSVLMLNAAIVLINSCDVEQLEKIPGHLSRGFFAIMRNVWVPVRNAISFASPCEELYFSNIRVSHVAECLFRVSMCVPSIVKSLPFNVVERGVFGFTEFGFRDFVLNHWEVSAFLVRRMEEGAKIEDDDFFGPLSANLVGSYPSFLSSMLPGMVSCLPIASDEFNILSFLEEVQNKLGCPLVYQQDIRVVTTKSKKEVHFFEDGLTSYSVNEPHCLSTEDILKCEEAYNDGYTIALRGMEFRYGSIAAIAEGLASAFGQPSVGANLYLTPPNSQGLACHYDDHCVFVCQLVGSKKWRVSSKSNGQLPQLYDPVDKLYGAEVQIPMNDCKQYFLREGDVLYIPRGVLHEACTENVSLETPASCSLHITLGIEVEPPFEWEGFVHGSFFNWYQNQKQVDNSFESSLHVISANLIHVAIGLIGGSDPTFRKACLIASTFPRSHTDSWLDLGYRIIFGQLMDKIGSDIRFSEVFRSIETAVQENKDPLRQIKWLDFLNMDKESRPNHEQNTLFMEMRNLLSSCVQHRDNVEAAFDQLSSRFCENVIFEDAVVGHKLLLDKYRKVRKQYMDGMVSLHRQ